MLVLLPILSWGFHLYAPHVYLTPIFSFLTRDYEKFNWKLICSLIKIHFLFGQPRSHRPVSNILYVSLRFSDFAPSASVINFGGMPVHNAWHGDCTFIFLKKMLLFFSIVDAIYTQQIKHSKDQYNMHRNEPLNETTLMLFSTGQINADLTDLYLLLCPGLRV